MQRRRLSPDFWALWWGSTVTNLGDGMRLAALPLLASRLTDSPILIAGVMTAIFLPWLLFAPVVGAYVDRWRRRETVVTTQLWRAVVMVGLAALVLTDTVVIWHVYATAILITVGEILGASEVLFGFVLAAAASAGLLGSLIASRVVARMGRQRLYVTAFSIEGVLLVAVGLSPNIGWLFAWWFLLGIPAGIWMPVARAMQQRMTPTRLLGRVNVASRIVSRGAMVFAALAGGVVASLASVRTAVVVGGLLQVVAAIVVSGVMRNRDLDAGAQPGA